MHPRPTMGDRLCMPRAGAGSWSTLRCSSSMVGDVKVTRAGHRTPCTHTTCLSPPSAARCTLYAVRWTRFACCAALCASVPRIIRWLCRASVGFTGAQGVALSGVVSTPMRAVLTRHISLQVRMLACVA